MKSSKMLRVIACLLLVCMVFGACSSNSGNGGNTSQPAGGEVVNGQKTGGRVKDGIVFALNAEPTSLDPQVAAERITYIPVMQLYDRLVMEDPDTREIQPMLAESWEFNDDNTEITFKIKEGVKFHDGSDLTVDDVVFSINRAINDAPSKLFSSAMDRMEKVDDTHCKLILKYAFSPVMYCLNNVQFCIVKQAAVEADEEGFSRNPIGTGPYKFVSWTSGADLVMEAFPDYWRGEAEVKKVTFRTMTDTSASVMALEAGDVDVIASVPNSDRANLLANNDVEWYETEGASIYILTFNTQEGLFAGQTLEDNGTKLRQAISYAINRDDIILGALEGIGTPLYAPMASFAFGYPDLDTFQIIEQDQDKAKALLAEAGYPDGFTVTLRCTEAANYTQPAVIIQDQLRQVGITVELDQMERGTYLQEVYRDMKYEMSIWSMTSDYPDGDSPTYVRLHGSMIGNTNNYVGVNIPELNEALEIGRTSQDQEERKAAYLKVSEIVRDYAPMIPLYSQMNNVVANAALTGVRAHYGMVVDIYSYGWRAE